MSVRCFLPSTFRALPTEWGQKALLVLARLPHRDPNDNRILISRQSRTQRPASCGWIQFDAENAVAQL